MNPLCANRLILFFTGFSLKGKAMCATDRQTAHVYCMKVCGVGAWPTIPLCTIPCMLCRCVPVVTCEQSSVPSSILFSLSKGRIIHGSFMIVSAWVAVRVIYI